MNRDQNTTFRWIVGINNLVITVSSSQFFLLNYGLPKITD